jgi:hypothetical protein
VVLLNGLTKSWVSVQYSCWVLINTGTTCAYRFDDPLYKWVLCVSIYLVLSSLSPSVTNIHSPRSASNAPRESAADDPKQRRLYPMSAVFRMSKSHMVSSAL